MAVYSVTTFTYTPPPVPHAQNWHSSFMGLMYLCLWLVFCLFTQLLTLYNIRNLA